MLVFRLLSWLKELHSHVNKIENHVYLIRVDRANNPRINGAGRY